MKKYWNILILTFYFLGQTVIARGEGPQILIQSQSASSLGYEAYLLSHDSAISYSQWSLQNYISVEDVKNFNDEIDQSLQQYTKVPGPILLKTFKDLIKKAQYRNWPVKIRKKVSRLWLLTYQLESSPPEKKRLLRLLANFFSEFSPNTNEFPPPVISAWTEEINSTPTIAWQPNNQWDDYRVLIVNGRVFDLDEREVIQLPDRPVRVTGFSNLFLGMDQIISGRKLLQYSPPREYMSGGECDRPRYHPQLHRELIATYFDDLCIRSGNSDTKMKNNPHSPAIDLASHGLDLPPQLNDRDSSPPLLTSPSLLSSNDNSEKKSSLFPQWSWFIAAGIATALIIHHDRISSHRAGSTVAPQNIPPTPKPVEHHGF